MPSPEPTSRVALVIDDDSIFRDRLARSLERRGWSPHQAGCAKDALELARLQTPDLAIIDLRLAGESGLDLLAELREILPDAFVLILTGYGSIATAIQATRLGADHYLGKPADADQILAAFEAFSNDGEPGAAGPGDAPTPSLARVEWEHIQRVLADCNGNITQAARLLGLHRRSLQRKLSKYPPAT